MRLAPNCAIAEHMPEYPSQSDLSVEMVDTALRDSELPDAREVFSQAAALAQHLQQAGVQWLPVPQSEEVKSLISQFQSVSVRSNPIENTVSVTSPQTHGTNHPGTQQSGPGRQRSETQPTVSDQTGNSVAAQGTKTAAGQTRSTGSSLQVINGPYPGVDLPDAQRSNCLTELADQVASCQRCPQLTRHRNHTVFGEGNVHPRVVFFGEAPGADEDRTGRPFVGAAGQLLTKMIEACKFSREDVYILNTIKCRPPNNRNPEVEERDNCRDFYRSQLNTLRPEYIVCLGAVAAQELLQSKVSVGSLRGKFHRYHESKVLVTYHPAYLLREPTRKAAAWQDLQLMLRDAQIDY